MRTGPRVAVLAATLFLFGGSRAWPQTPKRPRPLDISLTVSGGVSLGSYQAGFLYLVTEALKRFPRRGRLKLVTGASAGSINALLTALSSCLPPNDDPTRDLGWLAWGDVSYQSMFVPAKVTPVGIFTRDSLEGAVGHIRRVWRRGLRPDCDLVLGVTITRLVAREIHPHPSLRIPRQQEWVAFRLRGRGAGKTPSISNYVDPRDHMARMLLPFGPPQEGRRNVDLVRDLLFASSAFPVAFPPQRLDYCMTRPARRHAPAGQRKGQPRLACTKAQSHALFIDGGVFDNTPLRLAVQLAKIGLRRGRRGHYRWRAPPDRTRRDRLPRADRLRFIYLDPGSTVYPPMRKKRELSQQLRLLPFLSRFASSFIDTARRRELYALVEEQADLSRRVRLTRRRYPTASGHLAAFLGFFEKEFRRFDFYLGIYDAYQELRDPQGAFAGQYTDFDIRTFLGDDPARIPVPWRPFACMLGWYDPAHARLRGVCQDPGLREFRILVQVSLDRLYSHLRRLARKKGRGERVEHHHWARVVAGRPRPRLAGLPPLSEREVARRTGESHFEHTMRLLARYRFRYRDMGMTRDEAEFGPARLRRRFLRMLKYVAAAQPSVGDRTLLQLGGRLFINRVAYEPPRHWGYVVLGTAIEGGGSVHPFDWNRRWLRFNLALQLKHVTTLLTSAVNQFSVTALVGPEFELLFWTSPVVQPLTGIRIGYQLGHGDTFGTASCTPNNAQDDPRHCSQLVLQNYWAVALLERFRLQVTFEFFPQAQAFAPRRFAISFGLGFHFF